MQATAVTTKDEVLERVARHADQLRALGLARIGVFGSFVRETPTPESDIDLLLEFRPNEKTFDRYMDAIFLLEDILARRIDAVTPEGLHSRIASSILREAEYVTLDLVSEIVNQHVPALASDVRTILSGMEVDAGPSAAT